MANNTLILNNVQPPLFEGQNYEFWCVKMETLFLSLKVADLVNNGFQEPEDAEDLTSEELTTIEDKKALDAGVLGIIQRAVSATIFPRIMSAKRAKEAWDILKQEYEGDAKVRTVRLQSLIREFENMKIKENESLNEYCSKFMELVNIMRSCGDDITDQRIVQRMLISLPRKFDAIVSVIEVTKDISVLSVQDLISSLKIFEQRLSHYSEATLESAFQSKVAVNPRSNDKKPTSQEQRLTESFRGGRHGRGRGRNQRGRGRGNVDRRRADEANPRQCNHCKKVGHEEKDCWFKGQPQCFNCKKFGHVKKDCRFKDEKHASYMEEKEPESTLFFMCQKNKKVWHLDSGCSNHMTSNEEAFMDVDSSYNSAIIIGNGDSVEIKGRGDIGVQTK